MKSILFRSILFFGLPFTLLSSFWLKLVKKAGEGKIEDKIFMALGILPILDHYYQPLINPRRHLTRPLRDDRDITGIDLNVKEQLSLLAEFNYSEELLEFPLDKSRVTEFYYNNSAYCSGDAEFLYNMVRHFKPAKIIEIGSGYSTLMVRNATIKNKVCNFNYNCQHICIEPYEMPWLEQTEVELIREKVETMDKSFFQELEKMTFCS